ncbi:aminoglycoside 3-N-acetyltransferase I [Marinococcus luteus]|uniref:Aminoglycoside 3-N-acetyltransferase I n=1 Tax=Marinococcus luteus TaxID=1122204 RepID=A0A1H2RG87_9BACI|nr:GNAT family N-acetyltransferase [Marinococcus luteus]SDW17834.1 aminoglycoside 3-N-acetyltransferase I [Marinococcus luteus]
MAITCQRLKNNGAGLKQMRKLNEIYAEAFEEKEVYTGNKPSDSYLLKQLSNDRMIVCTAVYGELVVAGLTAYVMNKMEEETCEIYIYDLAVDAGFRRRKIATTLLIFLLKEAENLDASAVFIQADKEDAPAVALYESMGEREEMYHFDIYLKKENR